MQRPIVALLASVFILFSLGPASAWAQAGTVRVGGTFGLATYDIEDINDYNDGWGAFMRDYEDWLEDEPYYYGVDTRFAADDLGGGATFSGFAEYMVTNEIGVGIQFMRLSGTADHSRSVEYEFDDWGYYGWYEGRESGEFTVGGNLVSLIGVYHLPLGATGASLRLGGGVGYLFGATLKDDYSGREEYYDYYARTSGDRQEVSRWSGSLEASGSGVAFHGLVGIEYPVTPQLLVVGDAGYRFASVDELKVDDWSYTIDGEPVGPEDMLLPTEEGEVLKIYYDDAEFMPPLLNTELGEDVTLDFGGLYFTLGIAYVF